MAPAIGFGAVACAGGSFACGSVGFGLGRTVVVSDAVALASAGIDDVASPAVAWASRTGSSEAQTGTDATAGTRNATSAAV
ncbi:hypothetical protein OCH7691_04530 [Oceanibacterium hippocampi]|uniref:Uncharacterized protein n=1 Tax=Oceanibacterium hippocampi TaxID=745714 RepID=A0A1Y5TZZ2_9PROT|nr:hypothetical protein OCH7691_04530 [Oceanibacterium hippocampi]